MPDQLSDDDRRLLAFERQWWKFPGAKEDTIRQEFGISPTRYYQRLGALLDNPLAEQTDPMLIRRLRRLRDERKARRCRT